MESDIRAINMDSATAKAAIATGDIDAAFGGYDLLSLRDQGLARVLYLTDQSDPSSKPTPTQASPRGSFFLSVTIARRLLLHSQTLPTKEISSAIALLMTPVKRPWSQVDSPCRREPSPRRA